MSKKISKHITFKEATQSGTATRRGIKNEPSTKEELDAMKLVAEKVFEPVREHFGVPIAITSFFRCYMLNKAVGGSRTSDHIDGKAIDMDADVLGKVTNREIFDWIRENLEFDQLIWEYGTDENPNWVHASYRATGNRNQVKRVQRIKGKPVYTIMN